MNHRPICVWFFFIKITAFALVLTFSQETQAKGIFSKLKELKSRIIKGKKTNKEPTSVLFLGDSMSMGAFGSTLDSRLRDAGFEVHTYVAGGATPYYWLSQYQVISSDIGFWEKTPKLERRLKKISEIPKVEELLDVCDPDIVVVQTGTNLYSSLRSKRREQSENIQLVSGLCRDMAEAVTKGGRRCYWIAPPESHPERFSFELQEQMSKIMESSTKPFARFFDSRKVTEFIDPYPETDGIHYGATEAKAWAENVAKDFLDYAGVEAVGRRALDPNEPFDNISYKIKKAEPVDPSAIVWNEIDVQVKLKTKTVMPNVKSVTYRSCLVLYEYEVTKVKSGYYPYDTLRIAHFGVYNRKYTSKSRYRVGYEKAWKLMPLSAYPSISRIQMFDDLEADFDKPIYFIKQS